MNKKITKILVFALAFALLLGASLAIVSSAESKPEIISKNIEYGEKFAIMYAVDASTVAEGTVTLNIYAEEPTADSKVIASYTKNAPETIKVHDVDTSAYVFITNGVAAKDLGDFFYAQAIDAKGNKSDVVKYSVVEYMLERLYGGETITADQEEMYRKSLEFGEAAQELLSLDDEIQVADYKYVRVEGGTVNGVEKGIFLKGDALTLALNTAVPQGGFFFGWKNVNGEDANYSANEFTLSESAVITADVEANGTRGYFDAYSGYDFTGWVTDYNSNKVTSFNTDHNPHLNIKRINGYMSLSEKGSGKQMYLGQRTIDDNSVMAMGSNTWGSQGGPKVGMYFIGNEAADTYVFESDVYFDESGAPCGYFILSLSFAAMSGDTISEYAKYSITVDSENNQLVNAFGYDVPLKTWVNVAVEYSPAQGVANYYLNGRLVHVATLDATDVQPEFVYLNSSPYAGTHILFDNVYVGKKSAHLTESDEYVTFNDGTAPIVSRLENKGGNSSYSVVDLDGEKVLKFDKNPGGEDRLWLNVPSVANATKFVFEAKVLVTNVTNFNNFYIDFMNGTNTAGVYGVMIQPSKIYLSDYFNLSGVGGKNSFSDTTYFVGGSQWINLKLVGYKNASDIWCVEYWINGQLLQTSTCAHWQGVSATDINGIRIRTFSSLDADIYFDDVKAYKIAE